MGRRLTPITEKDRIETSLRKQLRSVGFQVESVSWINREDENEFAALVAWSPESELLVLDFLTHPRSRVRVTRTRTTRTGETWYYIAPVKS